MEKYEYLKFKHSITEEYLLLQHKFTKLYNDKTIVLMQVGSFHEAYSTNERGYDLFKLSDLLNTVVSRKNKKILEVSEKNPNMLGFPIVATPKFIKILVDNGYHVIKIDQVTEPPNPKRAITEIFSPGTYIDNISNIDSNYILSIYIEEIKQFNNSKILFIGLSIIDLSIGKSIIHETFSSKEDDKYSLDETLKFIYNFNPIEVIINYKNLETYTEKEIISYLELNNKSVLIYEFKNNEIININYQNKFLKDIFKIESYLSPIEELDLENLNNGRISFILLLDYCIKQNSQILNNIFKPEFYNNLLYLHLGNNALDQLDIINNNNNNNKSLFDIINFTSTALGRRYLKFSLANPISNNDILLNRYNKIYELNKLDLKLEDKLKNILDIERLHRKISLQTLHPYEFVYLNDSYVNILELYNKIKDTKLNKSSNDDMINFLNNYIDKYTDIFNFDEMSKYNINDISSSFYKYNIIPEIDELQKKIDGQYKLIENFKSELEKYIDIKKKDYFNNDKNDLSLIQIQYNDKDKYHLILTSKRGSILKSEIKKINKYNDLIFRDQASTMKITCNYIDKISEKIVIFNDKLKPLLKKSYKNHLIEFYNNYNKLYLSLNNFISELDFLNSGNLCSIKNKYSKPIIQDYDNSFIDVKGLRHPIIEKLIFNKYVTHDIILGKNNKGILLYGLNSAGKSSLMKAIGLNIILAQIGYFVSANEFIYNPYKSIFTRISNTDNLHKGLSSFALELVELKAILKRSGKNTLVLADEVCKGTEHNSALIIVSTMIKMLLDSNTTFISATHLHELVKLDFIKKLNNLGVYNIGVRYENDNIIFDRNLEEGNGIEEYGLNFAKYLIKDNEFISISNEVKELFNKSNFNLKKSSYNTNILIDKCSICNNTDNLEIHHIKYQKYADKNGFINQEHKDHSSNLVILCSKCHDNIHNNKILINGYDDTIKGSKLNYNLNERKVNYELTEEEINYIKNTKTKNLSQKKLKEMFDKKFDKSISIKKISSTLNL